LRVHRIKPLNQRLVAEHQTVYRRTSLEHSSEVVETDSVPPSVREAKPNPGHNSGNLDPGCAVLSARALSARRHCARNKLRTNWITSASATPAKMAPYEIVLIKTVPASSAGVIAVVCGTSLWLESALCPHRPWVISPLMLLLNVVPNGKAEQVQKHMAKD
jgi:hypothetical protein